MAAARCRGLLNPSEVKMNKLRLAIAGAGVIGRRHIQLIREHSECELVAIADPMPAAAAVATDHGVAAYPSLDDLLAAERPDAVIVATPNALHVPQALACIAAGVPVLIEKPVADRLDEAQRLTQLAAHSGVPVLVGHHRRHSPVMEAAAQVLRSGRLGTLVAVQSSAVFAKPASYFTDGPWRARRGGGPILINLVHEVDFLRALLGEITEVQAMASSATRGFEVEDTAAVSLRFACGVLGSLLLSDCGASPRSWEQTSGEDPSYDHHPEQGCCMLVGTRGSLLLPTLDLYTHAADPSWQAALKAERLPRAPGDPLKRQLDHFCAVVRREALPRCDLASATRTLQATLAIAQSAACREAVVLDDPFSPTQSTVNKA
jgi:predicted dehydrogenase